MRSTPGLGRLGAILPETGGVTVNARALSLPSVGSWVARASGVAALLHAHAQSDHTAVLSRCVWGWSWVLHAPKCLGIVATGSMWLVTSLLTRPYYHF